MDNVFSDGSHRLVDFEVHNIKVIQKQFGFNITDRCLADLINKTIHKDANAHKNVC